MRTLLLILALCCFGPSAFAGGIKTHRMRDGSVLRFERHESPILHATTRRLGSLPTESWDANEVYRVPVILFSFADCDFSCEDPKQFYDDLFNKRGHNLGVGPGCVADYFRDQSGGLFNVQFDIFGPVKLSSNQKKGSSYNQGTSQFYEAGLAVDPQVNFADYVWPGEDGVRTVIFIYAGYGGNEVADVATGCIHPNTSYYGRRFDNTSVSYYSASAELWSNNTSCGFGTVCHEYCHTFGLRDLYPTISTTDSYSIVDEWDLMDGGCFSDDGWCPPNLSIYEREQMEWQKPVDLTTAVTITNMPPFSEGGLAYRILNNAWRIEYYLLENRQQTGWDLMLPGHGLLVTHVDDNTSYWGYVNNDPAHHCFDYFHADNHDFKYEEAFYGDRIYDHEGRNIRLRNTAYPYTDSLGVVHDALTDTTTPAATLFHARRDGSFFMGKPITEIQETDGLISFRFSNTPDAITSVSSDATPVAIYDLQGNLLPLTSHLLPRIYIVRYSDGTTKKVFR